MSSHERWVPIPDWMPGDRDAFSELVSGVVKATSWSLRAITPDTAELFVSASFRSWGEVVLLRSMHGGIRIVSTCRSPLQAIDMGKNLENVSRVETSLLASVAARQ